MSDSDRVAVAGGARMVGGVRPPLGLLSVKMREHREKEKSGKSGSNGPENEGISKEGQFASPGMPSVPIPHNLLTLVAEQSTLAAKADISQGPPSVSEYNKVLPESNVKPRARKPLAPANANPNPRKKSKAASKPSRRRVQVVLTHAREEKENFPNVSSDEIDDPLQTANAHPAQKNSSKEQEQEKKYTINDIYTLPDPFVLTSDDECDDPVEGGLSETKGGTDVEPDRAKGAPTADSDSESVTTVGPADVGDAWTRKSCLRAANASPKGHTVSFKDPLLKFHFYYYPDPNDIWSRCGLSMRPTRKSFTSTPLIVSDSPASHSQTPAKSY